MNKIEIIICRAELTPYKILEKPNIIFPLSKTQKKISISENDALYKNFNQSSKTKKSFHFSLYNFETNAQKFFFDKLLFYDNEIAHLWFTQENKNLFFYFDENIKANCFFTTQFFIEMKNKNFFAIDIGEKKFANQKILLKKQKLFFTNQNMQNENVQYLFLDEKFIFVQLENVQFSLSQFLK